MQTKQIIKELQAYDPDGNKEVEVVIMETLQKCTIIGFHHSIFKTGIRVNYDNKRTDNKT